MRFLGVGDAADLGALYLRLGEEGHDVKVYVGDPLCIETLSELIPRVADWRAELDWLRAAGEDGCILFENVGAGRGAQQDALRRKGLNVIGSSAYGARLETDRAYAQRVLADLGLSTAAVTEFADADGARRHIEARPKRYVLKFNSPNGATHVGRQADGGDVLALLATCEIPSSSTFILMDHIEGIEMGVGAYFNGEDFLEPACLDWEHKRFFPNDMGELTGEMGTVVTYSQSKGFFERTLGRMRPALREHGYCGYINLNTIVNNHGIWPLEFTCRFGYPGFAILEPLQRTSWGDLFKTMLIRKPKRFEVELGFAVGVVITTPPFPYSRYQVPEPIGLPVLFEGLEAAEFRHLHYGEVGLKDGVLVTTGATGYTMVATGTGATVEDARCAANALARKVIVPNARYRTDIGQKLIDGDLTKLEAMGMFDRKPMADPPASGRAGETG